MLNEEEWKVAKKNIDTVVASSLLVGMAILAQIVNTGYLDCPVYYLTLDDPLYRYDQHIPKV